VKNLQWYLKDKRRLALEIELIENNGVNFQLCQDDNNNLIWRGPLSVLGHYHGDVRLIYTENFPSEPMKVYVFEPRLPKVNIHIHEDGSICYIEPNEWNANWTAYAVYLTTIRFLNDFYSGRMDNSLPLSTVGMDYRPRKSFLERLEEMIFG
jgi:hypothetical protein